jgi:hypothetical protein
MFYQRQQVSQEIRGSEVEGSAVRLAVFSNLQQVIDGDSLKNGANSSVTVHFCNWSLFRVVNVPPVTRPLPTAEAGL